MSSFNPGSAGEPNAEPHLTAKRLDLMTVTIDRDGGPSRHCRSSAIGIEIEMAR
jgi:hypothetical protein